MTNLIAHEVMRKMIDAVESRISGVDEKNERIEGFSNCVCPRTGIKVTHIRWIFEKMKKWAYRWHRRLSVLFVKVKCNCDLG